MNRLIKMFKVILVLISVIAILMVVSFVVMFVELAQYKECSKNNFTNSSNPTYTNTSICRN